MILAYHSILSVYGFWLPNDPRGSWSEFVGSWELLRFGKATTATTRESLVRVPHDNQLREDAKMALKHPPVRLFDEQIRAVARRLSPTRSSMSQGTRRKRAYAGNSGGL